MEWYNVTLSATKKINKDGEIKTKTKKILEVEDYPLSMLEHPEFQEAFRTFMKEEYEKAGWLDGARDDARISQIQEERKISYEEAIAVYETRKFLIADIQAIHNET